MQYPFAAIVAQEQLKTALLLNAICPAIGGVLIRGEKGTAKSTAARSLADLLLPQRFVKNCPFRCDPATPWPECPHCSSAAERIAIDVPVPFVDLPIGATEDRVLGTLDFERAMRDGTHAFQPGLLASAHRGMIYIDEVNLLPDHLVDVLLDAAAIGVNTVQREGVSVIHPARFLLIGTMNPEEGELRPQLLDRFGLMVQVTGPREPSVRAEAVRRRLAFEADPGEFAARWEGEQNSLRERIAAARQRLPQVVVGDNFLVFLSQLCSEMEVDGLRPDLALYKTARAHAALAGRMAVTLEDIKVAAALVLPHRRKRRALEQPQLGQEQIDDRLADLQRRHGIDEERPNDKCDADSSAEHEGAPEAGNGNGDQDANKQEMPERVFAPAPPMPVRQVRGAVNGQANVLHGKRNPAPTGERGHLVRAVRDEKAANIAIAATIRAAALRGGWNGQRLNITPADLHRKECESRTGSLLVFVVDASGSMAARKRMEFVKGVALSLLQSAYEQRDEVAVIAFRGLQAEMLLPPTRSVELAEKALRALPTGGRTPLAHALVVAGDVIEQKRRSHVDLPTMLMLLSDGRANVALPGTTADAWQQSLQAARDLADAKVPALVLDTNSGFVKLGRVEQLAQALAATLLPIEDFTGENVALHLGQQRG